jgi:hypothetical protein
MIRAHAVITAPRSASSLIEHEGSLSSLVRGTDRPGAERVAIAGSLIRRDRHDRIDDDNSQKLLGYWRMHWNDLFAAERGYSRAPEIYRAIADRIGEANTLERLLDLHAGDVRTDHRSDDPCCAPRDDEPRRF